MSPDGFLAILGMALVTYLVRAGGLALASRLPETGFLASWLRHVPGAVLAALVAPAVLAGGVAEALAAMATLVYVLTRNLFATMLGGVVAVWVVRQMLAAWG